MGHLHLMLKIVRIIIVIRLWRIRCCLVRMGLGRIVGLVGVIMRVGARWGRLLEVRGNNIIIRVWIRRIIILVRNFLGIRLWILLRRKVDVALRSMFFFIFRPQRKDNSSTGSVPIGIGLTKNGSLKGKGKWKFWFILIFFFYLISISI